MLSVDYFQSRLSGLIDLIQKLVEIESPSTVKQAVDDVVSLVEQEASARQAKVERHRQGEAGDHLTASWGDGPGGVLLLTHLDTVHPIGTLERMPFERADRKLSGPGVLDMKASVAMALDAVQALIEQEALPEHRITLLCTSDEETGSRSSRSLIEDLARQHELVLCLEPGLADGSVKTRRKGIGVFSLKATGIPSHAGANPGDGVNAILEISHQLVELARLNRNNQGVTINAGRIRGGSRINVIAEHCSLDLDVRIPTEQARRWIEDQFSQLEPKLNGANLRIEGDWNRPPMPRSHAIAEAYHRAEVVASELGLELGEGETGGGSDANFVAPLGVPVLDGLGPLGAGAHSNDEYVWLDSLPRRSALLAGLLVQPL